MLDDRWPYSDADLSLRSKLRIWANNLERRRAQSEEAERVAAQPVPDQEEFRG
jgi:hypothetical protein